MPYESSYDAGLKPFRHDKDRGKWSSPQDFLFACLGHAFKMDAVFVLPLYVCDEFGFLFIIPYLLILAICVVPMVLMQSFLGQFSSTGFISVFRIAPLFKGIGYVSLIFNFITLTYYSMFGAIPLLYLLKSMQPTIPWSCEGSKEWMKFNSTDESSICDSNATAKVERHRVLVPSFEYFKLHLNLFDEGYPKDSYSWLLLLCAFMVIAASGSVLLRPFSTLAKFLRYSCMAVIVLICVCLLRFAFLPGSTRVFARFFSLPHGHHAGSMLSLPIIALSVLGSGWGSVLTMASYNHFKTDIYKYSWFMCLAHLGIVLGLTFMSLFVNTFLEGLTSADPFFLLTQHQLYNLLMIPTGITFTELPHLWTFLYHTMLILGTINLVVVQLNSVLTSLFDEFEVLRPFKKEVTIGSLCVLALFAVFFSSMHGLTAFEILIGFHMLMQVMLNLLLLLVVLWVYGRERFQRDLKFMIDTTYSTWMINVMRLMTPLSLCGGMFVGLVFLTFSYDEYTHGVYIALLLITILMWLSIPAYGGLVISQAKGLLGLRFRRCARPTDWYPVDPEQKRKYEDAFNAHTEISHPLAEENALDE